MNTGTKAFRCEGKGIESVRSDSHTRMLAIDVMVEGGAKFYRTIYYKHDAHSRISLEDIMAYVLLKMPTLKYEKVLLVIDN